MPYPERHEVEQALLKFIYEKGNGEQEVRPLDCYKPLADHFNLTDNERTQSRDAILGDGREGSYWSNMVQWARRKLNDAEYLSESKRGYWKLSNKGISKAKAIAESSFSFVSYPDEISELSFEGAKKTVNVNKYERSSSAKQKCIDHYGYACSVCSIRLENIYGERGRHLIHVHHLTPISNVGQSYMVDPIKDLRPVCPNCHAVIHRTDPPCSIEELKKMMLKI